uniref:C2 NT-type domain-containing protein n=1 Tax=Kalanchoe fedtschenkoi TaxID=63787 RepID=A0A7N0U8R1_KALFE
MVLGLRSKSRSSATVQVEFLVHVEDIKPWPPSKSLRSVKSVLLEWINGDQNFGSYASDVGDGIVEINGSFKLSTVLFTEGKSKKRDKYPNNFLEFGLFEPKKDNVAKSQLLGSTAINLSEYAFVKELVGISCPLHLHKSSRSAVQPILYITIQPVFAAADNSGSSSRTSFSKDVPLEREGSQSVTEIMSNDDEVDIASFTDEDDTSSHSSRMTLSASEASLRSGQRSEQNLPELVRGSDKASDGETNAYSKSRPGKPEVSKKSDTEGDARQTIFGSNTGRVVVVETAASSNVILHGGSIHDNNASTQVDEDDRAEYNNGQEMLAFERRKHSETQREKQFPSSNIPPRYNRGTSSVHRTTPSQKLKHMKSVQFPFNSAWSSGAPGGSQIPETSSKSPSSSTSEEFESRINVLEEELKEAAVIEIGLYSVAAEHGSSTSKVHAPARRLSRFYIHTWKKGSASQRASAARAIVSGFVLVSKACGNDVARLTFWLSNSILLRAIVCRHVAPPASYGKAYTKHNNTGLASNERNPWAWLPPSKPSTTADDWEDPKAFNYALEKFEAWIFSRIVESVWWQSFTPNMQTAAAKSSNSRKNNGLKHGLGDQAQGNFSIDLWKKAFKDAWERLCPIRAGGHECGCLPLMAKKVMEQLVERLDVAMLNAILRESADEMPTDPISDPISDSKVLPIPAGKSSFGAGAQLKNAIGSWSRWLSDLFDMDDFQPSGDDTIEPDTHQRLENEKPFKAFRLLNELSDLMMLPAEMLTERSTRKEVCPTFGTPLIKIVAYNFVPDEFNPDPMPDSVFETLDSEDSQEIISSCETLRSFPVGAVRLLYTPPTPISLAKFIGGLTNKNPSKSGSSVLKKSYTSDDETEELDSPAAIASIMGDSPVPRSEGGRKVLRYKLLREIWNENK